MTKKKLLIVALTTVSLAAIGTAIAYEAQDNNTEETAGSQQQTDAQGRPPANTRQEQSEGEIINVPDDVDPDQIKNYELITENERFKIRKLNDEYTITLYAIINNPNQYEAYRQQLKEYKNEALKYLQDKGINTNETTIIYEPNEAQDL